MARRPSITNDVSAPTSHTGGWLNRCGRRARLALAALGMFAVVIVGVRPAGAQQLASLSGDLLSWLTNQPSGQVRVIVPGTPADLQALLVRHPLPIVRWLVGGVVLSVNASELSALASDGAVSHLSGDMPVLASMSVEDVSTGADHTWRGDGGMFPFSRIAGVSGAGIGVAVIDSGITPHAALQGKVVASVSLVPNDPEVTDGFGHGTHVAGIIAGLPVALSGATPAFPGGIAPGARLINVRVLANDGTGFTSDVIAGIDWAIAHRTEYNIRVINLSVGHAVVEPAITDPLCQAVARAVSQGLVVAVSAGNDGRSASGAPVLGGIGSPGNSPFALTVGALNTWNTPQRSDDSVADYSSRGPSKFDFAIKPDLAAPGTRILSLEAAGSYLPAAYPTVHAAGTGSNAYMRLSGTSMAAPMVSGAVALLLDGMPNLNSTQIKLALQAGATYVPKGGLLGAGAGSLNIWASRQLTVNGLSLLPTGADGEIASGASFWDVGALSAAIYQGAGIRLLSALDLLLAWTNPATLQIGQLNLVGLLNPLRSLPGNRLIWGDQVSSWAPAGQIVWGSAMSDSDGNQIIWGTYESDQIIWGTTTMTAPDPH